MKKFQKIISFRIISEITVSSQSKSLTRMKHHQSYLSLKLPRFLQVVQDSVFQTFISRDKNIFILAMELLV